MTTISALPAPPTRADPTNFADRADAFMLALPTFGIEANAVASEINITAAAAAASALAAASNSGAPAWVTGTTYAIGNVRYSPIDLASYRRKTAGAGATDPSADTTNWERISGNVTLTGAQTLTNKTLSAPTVNQPMLVDPAITGAIKEDVYTIVDGAGFVIDPTNGSIQEITLGANRTPTVANFDSGESVTLKVADGTAYAITWSTIGVVWMYGTAPTLATTGWSWIELWKVGSTVYGAHIGPSA